jgi:hypothetical protein
LEKQDSQLEFTSDLVDDPIPITPEDKEGTAITDEEYEIQVGMSIVVQDLDETCLFDPLNGMFPTEFSSIVLRYMIALLKVELNHDLPKLDNAYSVIDNAHVQNHVSHNPHAIIMLENSCLDNAHFSHNDNCYPDYDTMLPDPYHSHHVLYCYTYMIGYSIDDIVGVNPITCASFSLCDFTLRILLVHHSLRPSMVRVDIPWDPGGFMAWC